MVISTIFLSTLAATSLMTAFSYLMPVSFRELYNEPLLLQYLITRFHLGLTGRWKVIAAWTLHYLIGLIFVVAYYLLWRLNLYQITWLSGLIYGVIIGLIGIGGWAVMFGISGDKPRIDYKGYYLQLFFAHLVFGMTIFVIFQMLLLK